MALRLPFWPVLDVLVVSDPTQMAALNDHPNVSRRLLGEGAGLNRVVHWWIYRTFSVGQTALGVFTERQDDARAGRQSQLERKLKDARPDEAGIAALARYVAGADPTVDVGVCAQQLIGRLFFLDYVATRDSYRAARRLLSLNPLGFLWNTVFRGRRRGRKLLWSLAHDDVDCIHATAVAVHGVVDALEKMRRRAADRHRSQGEDPATAMVHALVAPSMLLRSCTAETRVSFHRWPLYRGTLILFRLEAMYQATRDNDLAFARAGWNRCPAHDAVPKLLMNVWHEAQRVPSYGPRRRSLLSHVFTGAYALLNRAVPWHRLPTWVGVFNLLALRTVLREKNLHDTETPTSRGRCPVTGWLPRYRHERTPDGSHNDLAQPCMGAAGTRFGRLVPLDHTVPEYGPALLEPNPRTISNRLLARRDKRMLEATSLNLLAAAWIQFEVHDWFSHGPLETTLPYELPLREGDRWPDPTMRIIMRTRTDAPDREAPAPTYLNAVTHWWDASQLYGSDQATQDRVRAHRHGKLEVFANGQLPYDPATGISVTGFADNWWVGLALLHTLFTLEHNAICDRLRAEQPGWDDEQLFGTARLINAALIAKIHTLEWTPGILGHPALEIGMRGNWWGLAGERIHRLFGRISAKEAVSGIPGSAVEHHTAPFAVPEEFVAVYRMHPLIPDRFVFRSVDDGRVLGGRDLTNVAGRHARSVLNTISMPDLFYSFGVAHPGQITLGNYPDGLRDFTSILGSRHDVAAIDILRDRERGVPRYNAFRRLFRLPPIRSFDELNEEWAGELRAVYGQQDGKDDVERLDLMVGMFAETPPRGFAISDTAFRVFILMASRRLKSDRFFTTDYTADVYTQAGLDWIEDNDLKSVLTRHYPELRPALVGVANPFAPWRRVS